jgi:hypothetical protein
MNVRYSSSKCAQYKGSELHADLYALEKSYKYVRYDGWSYAKGNCSLGTDIVCTLHDPETARCRLNVRMSAALTLMACLILKAIYMILVNLLARGKVKQHCLTFGDVLVASASHPELRVQGSVLCQSIYCYHTH